MSQKQAIFVCCAIDENYQLIVDDIVAPSSNDAVLKFKELRGSSPVKVLGPFFKKRSEKIESNKPIKFDSKPQKAEYNGWLVNSFLLSEPVNHAMIFYIKKISATAQQPSKGTIIIPTQDLRFI